MDNTRTHRRKDICVVLVFIFLQALIGALAFFAAANLAVVSDEPTTTPEPTDPSLPTLEQIAPSEQTTITETSSAPASAAGSSNCTLKLGKLMLINRNFPVDTTFIANRRGELVNINTLYGIVEGNPYNGTPLLDAEAATHLNDMINAYKAAYPGHTMETRSCFRSRGTSCGRLCMPTGQSDHHTGYTCDLLDPVYGTELDTSHLSQHIEWQWLKNNSYKYGFIDRFPYAWAGGPMSAPINVDANGTTGLYETWHYRYVGIPAATDIATGKYNNGQYDSLEHYLKATGQVSDLTGCN